MSSDATFGTEHRQALGDEWYLLEVVHFERQLLQREQDELQQRGVVGGFRVREPGVEQPVATDSDEPAERLQVTQN